MKNELNDDLSMKRAEGLPPDEAHHDPHHPLAVRKAAIRTALVGIAHSVLLILTVWLLKSRAPGLNASDAEIVSFYSDPNNRRLILFAGLYLIPFAGIAFIWFIVSLQMWESGSAIRQNVLFSNVQLVCGVIYTALLFVGGASMSVVAAIVELTDTPINPVQARQFPQYGTSIILVFAMRMAAMFVLTTSNLGRSTGILPRWFIYVGFVFAVGLLLVASLSAWLVIVFPAWILVFSTILLRRARRIPRDLVIGDGIETGSPMVPR